MTNREKIIDMLKKEQWDEQFNDEAMFLDIVHPCRGIPNKTCIRDTECDICIAEWLGEEYDG